MTQYAVVAQSAYHDTALATGPYRSAQRAVQYAERLERKGWTCEVVELLAEAEVPELERD